MNCEICGKPITGRPLRTKIDNAVLEVCSECAKLGRVQKDTPHERRFVSRNKKSKNQNNKSQNNPNIQRRRNEDAVDEIVEDFNVIVRNARESKGWNREELGAKIYEKVSVITRIESGKMEPDLRLAKKLEKTLNIKLIEKYNSIDLDEFKNSVSGSNTLGSIVKIKRK